MEEPAAPVQAKRGLRRAGDTQKFVASFVLVAFVAVIVLLCWHSVPLENRDALNILIGFIGGAFTSVVGYYFGSTSASHQKDQAIQAMAATTANVTGSPTP